MFDRHQGEQSDDEASGCFIEKSKLIIFLEAYRVRLEEPRDNSDARVVLL